MKNTNNIIVLGAAVILIAGGLMYWSSSGTGFSGQRGPGPLDEFAKCLKDKGAIFYGAFWCPHCKDQKRMFGNSQQYLPYTECSTPDGRGQLEVCRSAGVDGYPYWVFAGGATSSGTLSLESLAQKTSCQLPVESTSGQ
jgi:hypothetical protein